MFRTDLLSIISSLNTEFTATGICHTGYVDCLLTRTGWNCAVNTLLLLLLLLLFIGIQMSLGGSSPSSSTDKTNKNKCT